MTTAPTNRPRRYRKRAMSKAWGYTRERNGVWLGHARIPDSRPKRYIARTFETEKEAEAWAKQENARMLLEGNDRPKISRTSLKEASDALLDALKLARASDGHMAQIRRAVQQALDAEIADLAAPDVVEKTMKLLINLKAERGGHPASSASRNNLLKHLRTIGNFAVRHDRIVRNPFLKIDKIPVTIELKEVFTIAELRRILDPKNAAHPFYKPFASMIYTGFRMREMVNLDWSWFMWDAQRIRMSVEKKERARPDLNAAEVWQGPKNKRFRITRLMAEYAEIMQPKGATTLHVSGRVFPEIQHRSNLSLQRSKSGFDGLLELANVTVRGLTPHSCRHTWTALMLASGENEMLVQQYAGHSQKEMTAHYAQSQEEFRVQVSREGWARGELSLIAPPQCTNVAPNPTVSPASGVAK